MKVLKYAAYAIGGATLIGGSFFLFTALSGVPMHDVKMVGGMFPEKPETETVETQQLPATEDELADDTRSNEQVYAQATTPLAIFSLSDPFSAEELDKLQRDLLIRMDSLEMRERDLDQREARLKQDRRHLDDLYGQVESMRNMILEERDENRAQEEELAATDEVVKEREQATYRAMAPLFADGKAKDAAPMLTEFYTPEEAAKVLIHLEEDRVRELLTAIHKQDAEKGKEFGRAYQDAKAD